MTTPLNDDERAELEALRSRKSEHDEVAKRDAESNTRDLSNVTVENGDRSAQTANQPIPDKDELPNTHWLNLANGETIESKGVMTHYKGIPVLHATEIPIDFTDSQPAHRF